MSAPRKFDEETRARAVRLYTDRLCDHGESKLAARTHVGELLDINPATLRNWIERQEVDRLLGNARRTPRGVGRPGPRISLERRHIPMDSPVAPT